MLLNKFYLDKEKDIIVELYKENQDEINYILRTPNHNTGNLITNLAKLCKVAIVKDENDMKIIKDVIPASINADNEIVYIYQKYIRYCLPDSTTTFCSTKTNYSAKENISIILRTQNNSFTYMFNPTTRLFEEEKTQSLIKRTIPEKENNER